MNKQEFLNELEKALRGMPQQDIAERIGFYSEIIDDKIEEGLTEEEAVATVGTVEDIAAQILAEIPLSRLAKSKIKDKKPKMSALEIVLLVLGSPIWLSLLIAAFAVIISLYAVLWSLVASVWAVMSGLAGAGVGVVVAGIIFIATGQTLTGVAVIGVGLCASGLSIFAFFGARAATVGSARLTRLIALEIKRSLVRKEGTK